MSAVNRDGINDLVRLAHTLGRDPSRSVVSGDSISVKSPDGALLHVQAQNTCFTEITPVRGYVSIDLPKLVAVVRDPALTKLPRQQQQQHLSQRIRQLSKYPKRSSPDRHPRRRQPDGHRR